MATEAFTDFVAGHGELWSAFMLALYMKQQGADAEFMVRGRGGGRGVDEREAGRIYAHPS